MRRALIWLMLSCVSLSCAAPRAARALHPALPGDGAPDVRLDNGYLTLDVYLPDARSGRYRGPRFDWSGMVSRVETMGHTFFGPWSHDPVDPADMMRAVGPSNEFGMKAGTPAYDEAKPGEPFIKIGVGFLRREDDGPYRFGHAYEIIEAPAWAVTSDATSITFRQDLSDPRGWGYAYAKTIRLDEAGPGFVIEYTLGNTGTRSIETDWYNHNLINIDDTRVGSDYRVDLGFPAVATSPSGKFIRIEGNTIFLDDLAEGAARYSVLAAAGEAEYSADFSVTNVKTGASVHVGGDYQPVRYEFYAVPTVVCPEPFIAIHLAPGEVKSWTVTYRFQAGE